MQAKIIAILSDLGWDIIFRKKSISGIQFDALFKISQQDIMHTKMQLTHDTDFSYANESVFSQFDYRVKKPSDNDLEEDIRQLFYKFAILKRSQSVLQSIEDSNFDIALFFIWIEEFEESHIDIEKFWNISGEGFHEKEMKILIILDNILINKLLYIHKVFCTYNDLHFYHPTSALHACLHPISLLSEYIISKNENEIIIFYFGDGDKYSIRNLEERVVNIVNNQINYYNNNNFKISKINIYYDNNFSVLDNDENILSLKAHLEHRLKIIINIHEIHYKGLNDKNIW